MAVPEAIAPPSAKAGPSVDHGRLEFLDAVRGLAAPLVVLQHVLEAFPACRPFLMSGLNLGALGVSAFFLVSGFIIPFSLERAKSLRRFWTGRFFRIWPLYLLTLFAVTAGVYAGFAAPPEGYAEGLPKTLLVNLTTLQHLLRVPNAVGAYWTLSYEFVFYVVCSILFAVGALRRADVFVPICAALVAYKAARGGPFGFTLVFLAFATGMLVCRATFGEIPRRRAAIVGGLSALAVVAAVALGASRLATRGEEATTALCDVASYAAGFALFFGLYALRRREFPRGLTYLGEISYSVYLVHGALFSLGLPGGPALHGLLVIGLTALISPLTYRFVERPAVALGRRLAKPKAATA